MHLAQLKRHPVKAKKEEPLKVHVIFVAKDSKLSPDSEVKYSEVESQLKCGHSNFVTCPHLAKGYPGVRIYARDLHPHRANRDTHIRARGQVNYNYPASIISLHPVVGEAAFTRESGRWEFVDTFIMVKQTMEWLEADPKNLRSLPRNIEFRRFINAAMVHEKKEPPVLPPEVLQKLTPPPEISGAPPGVSGGSPGSSGSSGSSGPEKSSEVSQKDVLAAAIATLEKRKLSTPPVVWEDGVVPSLSPEEPSLETTNSSLGNGVMILPKKPAVNP